MYMVLYVLPDTEKLYDLVDSWNEAGARGATILLSTGMARLSEGLRRISDDLPLMPSLHSILFDHEEMQSRTLFTIVASMEDAEAIVKATEKISGSLDDHGTGILAIIPLARVYGLRPSTDQSPPPINSAR